MSIANNIHNILSQLRAYEKKYQRSNGSVKLIAVSKGRTVAEINEAIHSGQSAFGENYLQEALHKIKEVNNQHIEWHFIGKIQSNKTRLIAENFNWAHTVCDSRIAQRLNNQRPESLGKLNICLELNVSQELTKSGLTDITEIINLAKFCLKLPKLSLRGLMAIPTPKQDINSQRIELHKLTKIKEELMQQGIFLDTLSMGMSDDLEAAVAEGSTLVRVGKAIFGNRRS